MNIETLINDQKKKFEDLGNLLEITEDLEGLVHKPDDHRNKLYLECTNNRQSGLKLEDNNKLRKNMIT